ncbi:nitrite reductase (NAD(P)H) small subunit family protein [Demequina lignilytica]|uniref:Nitrite reductase (NAD(P)H) small subunit family protein n=1 Tax=Demequina lignilytica TaxID=3051663 RepID=A0AB35MF89_9MICO|nr:nitrite reductase (NAD(P)H) small subunit family protein [Demequina sp. SYSU T0a273]MDN4482417.1 nitrite reductase (NAD(P)H) small subunit family protein [Demequina sp. SYSU T0a273]
MTAAPDVASSTATLVCRVEDLTPDLGVAALVGGEQVAIFLLGDGSVHCVQNLDPFSGAYVLSRGITGSRGEVPTIASPLYKQVFSLVDGTCLVTMDKSPKPGHAPDLVVHTVRLDNGAVWIDLAGDR